MLVTLDGYSSYHEWYAHTLHTEKLIKETTDENYILTLQTMLGMRILCIPKNLQRKSRIKSKNLKIIRLASSGSWFLLFFL